ncbi:MAG: GGDEF domain-containing protein [Candidatus Eiseniibacteriota bacterium]|jgi:diguanylate cyclase (GGDEF)-like protein
MQTSTIDHRTLIERVLPVDRLPVNVRLAIQRALDSQDARALVDAAETALRGLQERGLVRTVEAGPGVRRFQNLMTGEVISLRAPSPRPDRILSIPLPILPGGAQASLEHTRELVGLATQILTDDGDRVAEPEQLIDLLTRYACEMLDCDLVRFLTTDERPASDLPSLRDSGSPFTPAVEMARATRGNVVHVIHDLHGRVTGAEGDGTADAADELVGQHRSAAAIRLGAAGDTVQGLLEAWSREPHHFDRQRLALLELIADTGRELLTNSARLGKLVFLDSRTEIFNKGYFDIQLEHFLARSQREGRQMALAIADIDDFKTFNSRFGYQGGDQVLYRVAQVLTGHVRPFDCVARWGGEEFSILLAPPVQLDDARSICERLRTAVQQTTFVIGDLTGREHRTGVTVSIGGSLFPNDGQSADQLWRRANEELLEAKAAGKNMVRFRKHGGRGKKAR